MKKLSNNKPFVRLNLVRYKSHNTNSISKQFKRNNVRPHKWSKDHTPASQCLMQNKTMQWLTPVITLVTTVSNDSLRQLPGAHTPRGTNTKKFAIVGSESCEFWQKSLRRSAFIDITRFTPRDRDGGKQTALKKQRISLRGVYVWGVNSTVTKHLN